MNEKEFWREERGGSLPFRRELTCGWLWMDEEGEKDGPDVGL